MSWEVLFAHAIFWLQCSKFENNCLSQQHLTKRCKFWYLPHRRDTSLTFSARFITGNFKLTSHECSIVLPVHCISNPGCWRGIHPTSFSAESHVLVMIWSSAASPGRPSSRQPSQAQPSPEIQNVPSLSVLPHPNQPSQVQPVINQFTAGQPAQHSTARPAQASHDVFCWSVLDFHWDLNWLALSKNSTKTIGIDCRNTKMMISVSFIPIYFFLLFFSHISHIEQ